LCDYYYFFFATLFAALFAAAELPRRKASAFSRREKWALAGFCGPALATVLLPPVPAPIPATRVPTPPLYQALAREPGDGAIADLSTPPPLQMWLQTTHHHPMAFGYLSRTPTSVAARQQAVRDAIDGARADELWCQRHIRYVIRPQLAALGTPLQLDGDVALYDLARERSYR
jgi:hypothetical protein